jgi:hypothetical protein
MCEKDAISTWFTQIREEIAEPPIFDSRRSSDFVLTFLWMTATYNLDLGCISPMNCAKRGEIAPGGTTSGWRAWADPSFG